MLGNVKAFILSICMAVVVCDLLVSATPWHDDPGSGRVVGLLKTLGFTRRTVLMLMVARVVMLSVQAGC